MSLKFRDNEDAGLFMTLAKGKRQVGRWVPQDQIRVPKAYIYCKIKVLLATSGFGSEQTLDLSKQVQYSIWIIFIWLGA